MLLTNEDLLAISKVVDTKLEKRLKPIKKDITELKEDVLILKEDIYVLKDNVAGLKNDVNVLKDDVAVLKDDVAMLKVDVANLKIDSQTLNTQLHHVKLFQENAILPRLNTIESCYTDTYRRYQKNNNKMEIIYDDVELLKKTVTDHSEKLQKLA